jgi:cell division protein FtsZ
MDMGIGEFEEVGNTVKDFASENATVVVGTVIDPDMRDELRVTVVATGLGEESRKPVVEKPVSLVQKTRSGEVDYGKLDKPTVIRKQPQKVAMGGNQAEDLDYLDIPAFLRRQAD